MRNKHEGPGTGPDSTRVTFQGRVFRVETSPSKAKSYSGVGLFTEAIKDTEKLVEKDRPHFLIIKRIKDGVIEIDGPAPYWFRSLAENGTLIADTLKLPEGDIRLYPYDIVKYDNGQVSVVHSLDV